MVLPGADGSHEAGSPLILTFPMTTLIAQVLLQRPGGLLQPGQAQCADRTLEGMGQMPVGSVILSADAYILLVKAKQFLPFGYLDRILIYTEYIRKIRKLNDALN